ncbi:hypothetical protein LTR56_025355 [Elasticomyces elasticus]|nr:hypothetical protein LTR22_027212 [Elasticomyces elasticus]KAK3617332.1 hypothetical protein LTR56_025355 [Elasticomyces elasticus]KAK4899832.1 hypothetical protein LTR49_027597 [Elasticomyces elasticus]KAK5678012.1 hypothetical protein LTS12_029430 [Elasticomyces elasticus]
MASVALHEKQAPIKDGYKWIPSNAVFTLSSSGTLELTSITCKIGTMKQISQAKQKIVGLHQKTGDDDPEIFGELCLENMLLKALVACAGSTLKAVAMTLDIPIAEFEDGKELAEDKIEKLGKLTERYCVVIQAITKNPDLSVSLRGGGASRSLK